MGKHTILSLKERQEIERLLKLDFSISQVAKKIKRSMSTIRYEVKKGGCRDKYNAKIADEITNKRSISRNLRIQNAKLIYWEKNKVIKPLTLKQQVEILNMQIKTILEILQDKLNG